MNPLGNNRCLLCLSVRRTFLMGQCIILNTLPNRIFLGNNRQILNQPQYAQHLPISRMQQLGAGT